jgi:hypothetical protein
MDPGFSADCRTELEGMIERRVKDFQLDSRLKAACENDIMDICPVYVVRMATTLLLDSACFITRAVPVSAACSCCPL